MLHIDLWQSCQSGITLHRMHQCKQAEAAHVGWQPEEWLVPWNYIYIGTLRSVSDTRLGSQVV